MENKYNNSDTPTTETLARTLIASAIGAVIISQLAACTGPFGMVLGGNSIHESYNDRMRIASGGGRNNGGEPLADYTPEERRALAATIKRATAGRY